MKHYLLFYDVGEDYLAKRAGYRKAHLREWTTVAGEGAANPVRPS